MLANAMLFVRPAEIVPLLGELQLYMLCLVGAILFSIPQLHVQLQWRTMLQQPVNLCVLGVTLAIVTSRAAVSDFSNLDAVVFEMAKILAYYLVLVSVINTPERLRHLLMTTAICSTIMIAYSVMDYRGFCAEMHAKPDMNEIIYQQNRLPPEQRHLLRHVPDRNGHDIYGEEIFFFRLCGLGIFKDPNDLSMLIVATSVISLYFLTDPRLSLIRLLWIIPLIVMGVAMFYTYSRGGLLAGAMALMAWLITRYGTKVAIAIGILGVLCLPLAAGRAAKMDISGGTGQQRIQLWSDGLVAIKSSRFLFGIGEGHYEDLDGHVAHNSFVHAFVELGFFGGTLFFGCFFLPGLTFYLMKRFKFRIEHPELRRMFPYVAAILADWCFGMCSLSRCYTPSTYMIAGLGAAFVNLVGFYRSTPRPLLKLNWSITRTWITGSAALLAGIYVFVRVFARWG